MKGVWLAALQTEAQLIHRTGAVNTTAVKKTILCVNLVCVSLAFHGGSEKCILAWSGREKETLADEV